MKRLFITAMLSIAAASTALAADLPQPAPVQAPVAYIPNRCPGLQLGRYLCRHQRRLGLGTEQLVDRYQRWRGVSDATLLEHQR